jgi:hypothetical protein
MGMSRARLECGRSWVRAVLALSVVDHGFDHRPKTIN